MLKIDSGLCRADLIEASNRTPKRTRVADHTYLTPAALDLVQPTLVTRPRPLSLSLSPKHSSMPSSPQSRAVNKLDTMPPSTLDLLVLTFNCAKNLVNVPVFADHTYAALTNNATGLPDVIALYGWSRLPV